MFPKPTLLTLLTAITTAFASPVADLDTRQSNCPPLHIFGARETTAAPGYGSTSSVVNALLQQHPGATAEAINYPASGSNPTYSQSVLAGTNAVCSQVSAFARKCPGTKVVLVGYSQGAEIFDNALCGGGDPNQGISSTCSIANYNVAAAVFMGNPRFRAGAPYNVGSCSAGGFDARPPGQYCGNFNSRIKSYCDGPDPYCCNGNNAQTHNQYAQVYGSQAVAFVNSKV